MNSGISLELSSLTYVSVGEVVEAVLSLGQGSLLTKIDIKSAFRLISVHPDDRHLLGMKWEGALYVDCVLPFGLHSAPKIFNAVADALLWILLSKGIKHIYHYLDDYICVTPPSAPPVTHSIIQVCDALGGRPLYCIVIPWQ